MPLKDPETHRIYIRDWKRRKRKELGLLGRGKHVRKERTQEQKEQSKLNRKLYEKEWGRLHPHSSKDATSRLLWAARSRAKRKGLDFNLTKEDIVIPVLCPYLGIELVSSVPRGQRRDQCISLDRKDNSKGYIIGNVEVISQLANTMKNSASPYLLLCFANEIIKRYASINHTPLPGR